MASFHYSQAYASFLVATAQYAGGSGTYSKEKAKGQRAAGAASGKATLTDNDKIERLTYAAQAMVVDPQRHLENIRREQNEFLLRVLDEERRAEEDRDAALKQLELDAATGTGSTEAIERERSKLQVMFAEERKRASERIIRLTKEHEQKIRAAVVGLMDLGGKNAR
jgi:hypothetical protein